MYSRRQMFIGTTALAVVLGLSASAFAECVTDKLPAKLAGPGGFPERPLTMIVPYGPAGGSGQVAQGMADAVTALTGVAINRDHKPGGAGVVGMTAYMALPHDGYNVLEHIDDAASAHALDPSKPNPGEDLIPLVTSQITFSQIYIRAEEDRFKDWKSFIEFVKKQDGKATIANVSNEGSMERLNLKFILDHHKAKMQEISFDKGAPRYAALAGGQVDALFEQPGDVKQFLDAKQFKPILTIYGDRPGAFADVPSLKDEGMKFEPLLRFRGFYVHKDAPADRVKWLQWAFQKAFCTEQYQKFNASKFMDLIDSYRDTEGTKKLLAGTIKTYRDTYKELGMVK
ncbi:MAG: tripartite tricarboxylate transporter substrate binding protein [Pseudomonadota bacterium]|nr:tripartite tricarboxylate transporter substrate binding protein [Pseudomonadota bacterium]